MLLTEYVNLEQMCLNIFLKCARLARGGRKKISMEDSNGIDDSWVLTGNSLEVLCGN